MTVSSAKKLKITATNIRSALINNNKKIEKLDLKKSSFLRRTELQAERAAAESNIEKKKKGPIKSILGNVNNRVMSMKDRVLNFFGYVLMGMLVDHLPGIIKALTFGFNLVAPLVKIAWKVISTITVSLWKMGSWIVGLFDRKKAEKNLEAFNETTVLIEREIDSLGSDVPGTESDNSQQPTLKEQPQTNKTIPDNESKKLKLNENTADKKQLIQVKNEDSDEQNSENILEKLITINPSDVNTNSGINSKNSKSMMGDGSNSKISSSIVSSSQKLINKVNKTSMDLKGNIENENVNTVIVPVEIEKRVPVVQGGNGGGSTNNPEPMPSNSSSQRMLP